MTLSDTWRADQQYVSMLTHKVRGGQFINLSAIDAGIEAKVEVLKGARFPEIG